MTRAPVVSSRLRRRHFRPDSGYTMIELVMAMAVFAIGVTGVAAMQSATTVSNRHAKNVAVASAIAKTWQEELAVDATLWTAVNPASLGQTNWINLITLSNAQWAYPETVGTMGASFDALGNFTADPLEIVFCAHIKLTRLIQFPGSGLVRTDVRVFWPKHGHADQAVYCAQGVGLGARAYAPVTDTQTDTDLDNFHFVYATSAVRETPL